MSRFDEFLDKVFAPDPPPPPPPVLHQIALRSAEVIGYLSVALILIGVIVTLITVVVSFFRGQKAGFEELDTIRLKLGYYLLIALGLSIAKNIILMIFDPSFKDLLRLGELLIVTFVLHFFLHRDSKEHKV